MDVDIEVLLVGDEAAPPKGTLDPQLLIWAEENDYIIVSGDMSTLPNHISTHMSAGRHTKGVLWLRRRAALADLIETLYLIWSVSDAQEYVDKSLFIPL